MDFGRKQLEKFGWKEGKGLGKNEDGIANPIKAKLKFDNSGVGHNQGETFTNNWWERVFNDASKNIKVSHDESGVDISLQSKDSVEITTKNYSIRDLKKSTDLQYGSFLKTSKLTPSGLVQFDVKGPEVTKTAVKSLTDDELLAACGGRTAHKGARHGLRLSGKLARIEKQERMLLKKMKNVSLTDDNNANIEKKIKKLKKYKTDISLPDQDFSSTAPKKKNKEKKKNVSFSEHTSVKYYTPEADTSHESVGSSKDENSNEPILDSNLNVCDEGIEQDIEDNSEPDENHKSFEVIQCHFSDLSKAERKKLKKKRKMEKKNRATALFLHEALGGDDVSLEINGKKRKHKREDDVEMEEVNEAQSKDPKKQKYIPDKFKKKEKRERMLNSIVQSLDNICKISDDE